MKLVFIMVSKSLFFGLVRRAVWSLTVFADISCQKLELYTCLFFLKSQKVVFNKLFCKLSFAHFCTII